MLSRHCNLPHRAALFVAALSALAGPALAHHGWEWAEAGNSQLTGAIVSAKLGNPHGELTLNVGGESWLVEVGQPWRNEKAGLKDTLLVKGATLTVTGHKHADARKRVFKAERVQIDGKTYDLYPDRD